MIPIYRSTLTRLDLSSVLSYMVDNVLEGETSGQLLSKEFASHAGYAGGFAFRNPVDAIVHIMELMETRSILLPILAPYVLYARLEAMGMQVQFYDVDTENMRAILHKDTNIVYEEKMLRVGMQFLGGVVEDDESLPMEFLNIPKIELRWSVNVKNKKKGEESDDDEANRNSSVPRPAFQVILLENNTLCTAGGGAVVLVSEKVLLNKMKKKLHYLDKWVPLTDFNAGLALAQLKQIDEFTERVLKIVPMYKSAIQRTRHSTLPLILYKGAIPQCFPILIHTRVNEVIKYIRKQGVECEFPFQKSILGIMMETLTSDKDSMLSLYLHATRYVSNLISVPLYSALDNDEVSTVVKVVSTLP